MRRIISAIVVVSGMVAQGLSAGQKPPASESMGWGHCTTLAPLKKGPTLDGKLEPGEWDHATGTINFMNTFGKIEAGFNGMHMDVREGRTMVGFYGDTLYIAMISALPPRAMYGAGVHSQEKPRDAELIGDFNAIEIWLDPNRDRRESRKGDQAFYQIFVNSVGSVYDAKLVPGEGLDKGWNTEIKSGHFIDHDKKIWTTEIAISLKDFGWKAEDVAGRSMGMLIARNYKAPWNQATWFPHGGAFVEWYKYPRVFFTQAEPVARIESVGDKFWEAQPDFGVKVFNPGPARTVKAAIHIKSSDMPDLKNEKEIALPANGSADFTYKPGSGSLHDIADHQFNISVTETNGGKTLFNYTGMWSRNPRTTKGSGAAMRYVRYNELYPFEQKWQIRAQASPGESVGVSVYPSYEFMRVGLSVVMLVADPDGADKDKLSDSAVITVTRDGQKLVETNAAWDLSAKQFGASLTIPVKDMPEGEYAVTVAFNKHAEPIVKKYQRIKFPWEGTKVGVTDRIYPPFTEVKASISNTTVVCRNYGVGNLGLWNSIRSLGKEILAGPIVVKASSQNEEQPLTGAARLVKTTPMAAVYAAEAKHPAVTVKSVCTTEIDGCMKVELTLLPPVASTNNQQPTTLNSLILEIPLKDEMVPLWHASTTALRVNPVGETPKGEGVVWDSRKFPNGDWIGTFIPYMWFGGMERGLAVFGNNDRGWVLNWNEKKEFMPCQELIRKDGVLTIRLNLVQKPIVVTEPRAIVIGLMASPGKPIPYKDWRGITAWGSRLGEGFEYLPSHVFSMGCAVEEVFNSAYPINRDYTIYDAKVGIGDPNVANIASWKKRNGLDKPADQLGETEIRALSRVGQHPGTNGYGGMYWDEYHNDSRLHPETKVFNGEWGGNNMAASRRDFRCYYGAETVKRGIGLYFDNTFPHATKDLVTSDAYVIPGLGTQCSAGLWEQRDYHRRIWNIHREFGAKWKNRPMSMIHMSNTAILTMLTWNDMNVDLEWFYGPEPQQSKYGLPLLQAETSARQFGCVPYALAQIEGCKNPVETRMAERSKFGTMMTHEIRIAFAGGEISKLARILFGFGYGLSGVVDSPIVGDTVYNYWADDCPFVCDKPLVKGLLVKRGAELMMLVCSWDSLPTKATFTLDTKALGVSLLTAWDAEGSAEAQVAAVQKKVEAAGLKVVEAQAKVDEIQKKFEAKTMEEAPLKTAQGQLKAAELALTNIKALAEVVEAAASQPVGFSARKSKLTVGLEGYGVRIIRLK